MVMTFDDAVGQLLSDNRARRTSWNPDQTIEQRTLSLIGPQLLLHMGDSVTVWAYFGDDIEADDWEVIPAS